MDRFNGILIPFMNDLIGIAAAGGPLLKFASGNRTDPGFVTIYGLVQCAPYLTEQECIECLKDEVNQIRRNDNGKIGGKIVLLTCNFRFETYSFVNQSTLATPPFWFSPPPGMKYC